MGTEFDAGAVDHLRRTSSRKQPSDATRAEDRMEDGVQVGVENIPTSARFSVGGCECCPRRGERELADRVVSRTSARASSSSQGFHYDRQNHRPETSSRSSSPVRSEVVTRVSPFGSSDVSWCHETRQTRSLELTRGGGDGPAFVLDGVSWADRTDPSDVFRRMTVQEQRQNIPKRQT